MAGNPGSGGKQKLYPSATAALEGVVADGQTLAVGGFGLCGIPEALIAALRAADGIIIASPAYHGTVSGVVKNVLDYAQDLVTDAQPYFDGRAVGLIAVAGGWQAAGSTLATLRSITHALRGWPTPMAITANSSQALFDPDGILADRGIASQLDIMTGQVMTFARMKHAYAAATAKAAQLA